MPKTNKVRYNKMLTLRIEKDYYHLICKICDDLQINITDFVREAIDLNIEKYTNKEEDII